MNRIDAAVKHDQEKPRLELISPEFLFGLAEVLTFGAKKYTSWNWAKGFIHSRPYGALQRHLNAYWQGEDLDRESGLHHLDHAACELLFLRLLAIHRPDLDDRHRWQGPPKTSGGAFSAGEPIPEKYPDPSDIEALSQ